MDAGLPRKLQMALKQENYIVTLSTQQFYSDEINDFMKFYRVRRGGKVIYTTSSKIALIKFMSMLLKTVREVKNDDKKESNVKSVITQYIKEENDDKKKKKAGLS